MDSLSPFLQDSFIPYLMPVYPGAPQHSTGPRTAAGKHRSSRNATTHGLTAQSVVLAPEEEAAYQQLCQKFFEEYKPATATEATLVQLLADTSWRLNRIPQLEDAILGDTALAPQDAIEQISRLGLYSSRLSRQFLNTVKQLHELQDDRRQRERRELRKAAELLIQHDRQQIPWDPADDGFVFSRSQVEQFAAREIRLNNARIYSSAAFDIPPHFASAYRRRVQAREQIA
ncbi:MAG TPA: hypothetical protein VMH81_27745 [Bryobacteraceae bacterium]|nr:hypothetical protein [Bryobacteraceae bacterium]